MYPQDQSAPRGARSVQKLRRCSALSVSAEFLMYFKFTYKETYFQPQQWPLCLEQPLVRQQWPLWEELLQEVRFIMHKNEFKNVGHDLLHVVGVGTSAVIRSNSTKKMSSTREKNLSCATDFNVLSSRTCSPNSVIQNLRGNLLKKDKVPRKKW